MYRFSLMQLLMATALVAIVLTLVRSEGCGARAALVSDVEYSPNGKRLAVARHDARDARVSFKSYLANVSRTISVLDATSLSHTGVVEQRVKLGNQGPAFGIFRHTSPSLAFASDDHLLVAGFGDGPLSDYYFPKNKMATDAQPEILSGGVWISRNRSTVAIADRSTVRIFNAVTRQLLMQLQAGGTLGRHIAMVALSTDGEVMAIADLDGLKILPITNPVAGPGALISTDHDVQALEFSPDGELLMVAWRQKIGLFDGRGELVHKLAVPDEVLDACLSPDGSKIALATEHRISIMHIATMTQEIQMSYSSQTSCLAFSPDGRSLSGGGRGWVATWDAATGQRRNRTYVPGRVRPPWTLPAALFMVWLWAYRRIVSPPVFAS